MTTAASAVGINHLLYESAAVGATRRVGPNLDAVADRHHVERRDRRDRIDRRLLRVA